MILEHWAIERLPFRIGLDVESFYPGLVHEEALARIEFLVKHGRRLGALLGETGTGKSLTLHTIVEGLRRAGQQVALVSALGTSTHEFFWNIANQLGTTPGGTDDLVRLWRRIADQVEQNRRMQINTVLLVDDAGQAGPDLATQLLRLSRIDPLAQARWTMVLAALPQRAKTWPAALRELVDLRIDLAPWEENDTVGFVQSALVDAGRIDPVFTDEALLKLHELSGGVPRQVTRLADLAMLAGAAAQVERIDPTIVEGAAAEIEWTAAVG